jgi:hypothetical protein
MKCALTSNEITAIACNPWHTDNTKAIDHIKCTHQATAKEGSVQPEQIGSNESAVKVAVLIRPLLPLETEKGATNVLKVT